MKRYILVSYTENGLQFNGQYDTYEEAYKEMEEEYEDIVGYDDAKSWYESETISDWCAWGFGNEWAIYDLEVES